jgi:hypothetical protein
LESVFDDMSKEFLKQTKVERVVPNALVKTDAAAPPKLTSRSENAIHLRLPLAIALSFFNGCETSNYVPPVTPQMVTAISRNGTHVDPSTSLRTSVAELREGRALFVHRCIECHTLPALWRYTPNDWAQIVNSMSHRASLKPAERGAVIAYILAVRANER